MSFVLTFYCRDCQQTNKHIMAQWQHKQMRDRLVQMDSEWESFSGAHQHLVEYPDHYVVTEIVNEEEE